jgi:hypothetical protein
VDHPVRDTGASLTSTRLDERLRDFTRRIRAHRNQPGVRDYIEPEQ